MIKRIFLIVWLFIVWQPAFSQLSPEQNRRIDSLKYIISTAKHDTSIINAWESWDNIIYVSDPEMDLELNKKIDSLTRKNLKKPLSQKEKYFFLNTRGNALNVLGIIYQDQGDFAKAIDYYTSSLKIREEIGDKQGISASLNNIGIIYYDQGDYIKGLDFYSRSLQIDEEIGDSMGIANSVANIGIIYKKQGDYSRALEFFNRSLKIREEIGHYQGIANSLNNIGSIYDAQNEFVKAVNYYSQSLTIKEGIGDNQGIANSLNNIGNIYYELGDFTEAINYGERSLSVAREIGAALEIRKAAESLWESHKRLKNYQKALEMYELSVKTRDSLESETNQKEIIRQEFKYDYEKKEALANALHSAEMKQQESETIAEKKQQNTIIIAVSVGLVLVVLFLIFVFNRLRITRKQKNEIGEQKEIIEESHKEITDSIKYAKRLQDAILPSLEEVNKHLPKSFILFKPKDVVSGDFYWFEQMNGSSYIAAADCTGHGVPGAMVSVVCSNALHRSVKEFGIKEPAKILDKTRELVIQTFAKSGDDIMDGMDIALCVINNDKVIFSGANNPLWIVRKTVLLSESQKQERSIFIKNGISLIEHKSNKQPIGLYHKMKEFIQEEIQLHPGDSLYFFTDGFADQFGGKKGKKFMYKPFKKFLMDLHAQPMIEQKQLINEIFENWRGELEQIDDVCVIGVKI